MECGRKTLPSTLTKIQLSYPVYYNIMLPCDIFFETTFLINPWLLIPRTKLITPTKVQSLGCAPTLCVKYSWRKYGSNIKRLHTISLIVWNLCCIIKWAVINFASYAVCIKDERVSFAGKCWNIMLFGIIKRII